MAPKWVGSVLVAVIGATTLLTTGLTPAAHAVTGIDQSTFVTAAGTHLELAGEQFRFTGLNIYDINSRGACGPDMVDGSALDDALTEAGPGVTVVRGWFFQNMATVDGRRDWSAFDHALSVARQHNVRVIVTLGNQWADCDTAAGYKDDAWYRTGYRQTDPGGTVSYRDWVAEVAGRYRNDNTVLMLQLMNEAEVNTAKDAACDNAPAATILHDWASDVSDVVRAHDPNHLISLGTMGGGQCGTQGDTYKTVHDLPNIDVCEYHDYTPNDPLPGDQYNGLQVRLDQCRDLNKPLFVGEAGIIPGDVNGGYQGRAAAFDQKIEALYRGGGVGELLWAWNSAGSRTDNYDIGPGDMSLDVLAATGFQPSDLTRVTTGPGDDANPKASPDGRHVAYDELADIENQVEARLHVAGSDGTADRALTCFSTDQPNGCRYFDARYASPRDFAWSADSSGVVVPLKPPDAVVSYCPSDPNLGQFPHLLGVDGSDTPLVTSPSDPCHEFQGVKPLQNGTVYAETEDPSACDTTGTAPCVSISAIRNGVRTVVHELQGGFSMGTGGPNSIDVTPDGSMVVWPCSAQCIDAGQGLWAMKGDGTGVRRLTTGADGGPVISPDGTKIAFIRQRAGLGVDVYVADADGSNVTRVANGSTFNYPSAWSSDSKRLLVWGRDSLPPVNNSSDGTSTQSWLTTTTVFDLGSLQHITGRTVGFQVTPLNYWLDAGFDDAHDGILLSADFADASNSDIYRLNTSALVAPPIPPPPSGGASSPTITFTSPTDGAVFFVGQHATVDYSCQDSASTVTVCAGDIANTVVDPGDPLPTDQAGTYRLDVYAKNSAGADSDQAITYTVVNPATDLTDSDHDGLPNSWETSGIDVNQDGTVDYRPNSNPNHKDVFLEIDSMTGYEPVAGAVQDVVDAFAASSATNPDGSTGITLHVSTDEVIPVTPDIRFTDTGPAADDDFGDLKHGSGAACQGHFGTAAERTGANCANVLEAKRYVYHYAIFGNTYAEAPTSSGIAEIGGNDFMVTLGGKTTSWITAAGSLRSAQTGTLMHELGHNLGLRHGGDEDRNCKPNYLSVMNYTLQVPYADASRPLDYSRAALPPLNESALSETAGVQGPAGRNVVYGVGGVARVGPASGAIDWNGNGTINTGSVSADINNISSTGSQTIPGCGASAGQTLAGYNDWGNLRYDFYNSADFANGVHATAVPLVSQELTAEKALAVAQVVDSDKDGKANAVDNCRTVKNADQSDVDGDGIGDLCDPQNTVGILVRPAPPATSLSASSSKPAVLTIPSTARFDARQVAVPSIRLGKTGAEPSVSASTCKTTDVNDDKRPDLTCNFAPNKTGLVAGDTTIKFTGTLKSGARIEGSARVSVVR